MSGSVGGLRLLLWFVAALGAAELAACKTLDFASSRHPEGESRQASGVIELPRYLPSNAPLRAALKHFNRGHYGLAERHFRDAIERAPKDSAAWIGLAASYDRVGRFDLADRAYRTAIRLAGETAQILNNQGYSYMLRGNLVLARAKLRQARRRDPHHPTIVNNLHILDSSRRIANRR